VNEPPFEVTGEGEPVVVVPGFPFGGHAFRQLVPLLATRFRVLVADLSGFEEHGSRAQAVAIRGRLRDLGIERAAFVAHGTGGRIAQALAFEEGTDVDAIVLLGSVGPTEGPALPETAKDALARAHVEPLADADADAYLERWRRDPGAYARGRAVLEAGDEVTGLEGTMAAWEQPVFMLHGDDDRIVDPGIAERLSAAIPASTLGFVPESGHLLLDDAFETIGVMILEYLRARYLRAPHDHGGITTLQLERRPGWVDLTAAEADDADGPAAPDPSAQEVGPNA
jgi:pimeloyl-ACP methyl ester carboxylesterase